MTINISPGFRETGEAEFRGHPDIVASAIAADIVRTLAVKTSGLNPYLLSGFRSDLSIQLLGGQPANGVTPLYANIGGQLVFPECLDFEGIAQSVITERLRETGYFIYGEFSPDHVSINKCGRTTQSPHLNGTSKNNRFADRCAVVGHHLAEPYGLQGTFPSLIIARSIDEKLARADLPRKRPDGKCHVTVEYADSGFKVILADVSVAHAPEYPPGFCDQIRSSVRSIERCQSAEIFVNQESSDGEHLDFIVHFVQADFGMSKAKDGVLITGGSHQLGTDAVWGKCLYKASSVLLPYVFALSRAVCDATGARYASVQGSSRYGSEHAQFTLVELDPKFQEQREKINACLTKVPSDPASIRSALGLNDLLLAYKMFNDPLHFHSPEKPWKQRNGGLVEYFNQP